MMEEGYLSIVLFSLVNKETALAHLLGQKIR